MQTCSFIAKQYANSNSITRVIPKAKLVKLSALVLPSRFFSSLQKLRLALPMRSQTQTGCAGSVSTHKIEARCCDTATWAHDNAQLSSSSWLPAAAIRMLRVCKTSTKRTQKPLSDARSDPLRCGYARLRRCQLTADIGRFDHLACKIAGDARVCNAPPLLFIYDIYDQTADEQVGWSQHVPEPRYRGSENA